MTQLTSHGPVVLTASTSYLNLAAANDFLPLLLLGSVCAAAFKLVLTRGPAPVPVPVKLMAGVPLL